MSYEDRPTDDELLAWLGSQGLDLDFDDGFPNPASRVLTLALYRQDQRLRRIEAALVRAGLTNLEDFERPLDAD
jgi:hypothetical protein